MHWFQGAVPDGDKEVLLSRFGHTAVCIDAREIWGTELVVLYGGVSAARSPHQSQQAALDDVLVLQPDNQRWFTPRNLSNQQGPGARTFHCAAAVGSKMYVFGGHVMYLDPEHNSKKRTVYQDLWCLDVETWQWSKPAQDERTSPPKRDMASMIYGGGGKLVLFGGRSDTNKALGDLWIYDIEVNTWTGPIRTPGQAPSPRKMHTMCLLQQKVFLYGGERDSSPVDDMCWTLGKLGSNEPLRWTQMRVRPTPQSRFGHAMAVCNGRLGVYGGCLDLSSFLSLARNFTYSKELWVLDLASFAWVQIEFEAGIPTPGERMCHTLTPLPGGRLLLLGGRNKDRIYGDVWWLTLDGELPLPPPPAGGSPLLDPSLPVAPVPAPKPPSAPSPPPQPSLLQALLNPLNPLKSASPEPSKTPEPAVSAAPAGGYVPPPVVPAAATVGSAAWSNAVAQDQAAAAAQVAAAAQAAAATQQSWKRLQGVGTSAMDRLQGVGSTVTSTVSSLLQRGDDRARVQALNPLARLAQKGPAAPSYPVPGQPSPQLADADLHSRRRGTRPELQRKASHDTAEARQAAANAAALEQLRVTKLGLLPASSPQADPGSSTPPNGLDTLRGDAQEALVMLGRELLRQPQHAAVLDFVRSQVDSEEGPSQALLVDLARKHLLRADAQQLPLRHLDALLCDFRRLCLTTCVGAWVEAARRQGVRASTGSLQGPAFLHMCAAELRMRDIPHLLHDYQALLATHGLAQEAA